MQHLPQNGSMRWDLNPLCRFAASPPKGEKKLKTKEIFSPLRGEIQRGFKSQVKFNLPDRSEYHITNCSQTPLTIRSEAI
jgi:hypothetical protein